MHAAHTPCCPFLVPAHGSYVKPDIVFYGEELPERFYIRSAADMPVADLLLVMGTSLVVYPFAGLVGESLWAVHCKEEAVRSRLCLTVLGPGWCGLAVVLSPIQ